MISTGSLSLARIYSIEAAFVVIAAFAFPAPAADTLPDPEIGEDGCAPGSVSFDDYVLLYHLLDEELTRVGTSPVRVASLRRIRSFIYLQLKKDKNSLPEDQEVTRRLGAILAAKLGADRNSREARLTYARYCLFANKPLEARKELEKTGPADEKDLLYPLLLAYTHILLDDYPRAEKYLRQIELGMVQERELRLSPPVFCSEINAYRLYTPQPDDAFQPGDNTLVYVEVDGTGFRRTETGAAFCDLGFSLCVKDEKQKIVWESPDHGQWRHTYRGPVRDLHVSIWLRFPVDLPPGNYSLFVTCRDHVNNGEGRADTAFTLGNAPRINTPPPPEKPAKEESKPEDKEKKAKEIIDATRDVLEKHSGTDLEGLMRKAAQHTGIYPPAAGDE
jgi:hypothetical protein